jgi:REP element-mobilizing transposase RayT
MSNKPRDESPGLHHVTCRGNNKQLIFLNDGDRVDFLMRLTGVARKLGWRILAYCLMDNHYHLVIEIDERGMSDGFCWLNTGYATAFNARHGRINHLFGRRYWNKRLKTDAAVLESCRYVLLNPVRAGLVASPELWKWSSYRATIGLELSQVPLARDDLLGFFDTDPKRAGELFRDYILDGVSNSQGRRQPPGLNARLGVT